MVATHDALRGVVTVVSSQSLNAWLETHSERIKLRRVSRQVDPYGYESAAVLEQLERENPSPPPVLFESTRDLNGATCEFSLLFNAYASLPAMSAVLGLQASTWSELLQGFDRKTSVQHPPVAPEATPPVQTVIRKGDEVDLRILPWSRHIVMDGGPYFTPVIVAREPGARRYNISWNRMMYLDRRHVSLHLSPRHLWSYHRVAEERGEDLPVVIVLGHHPAFYLAGASLADIGDDEYDVAGSLLGEPVAVAPSVSYGDSLMIPAEAEAVLEGRMLAGQRAVEGPFGEFMRYVGSQKLSQVVEIDAFTWRPSATLLEIFTSHADHLNAHVAIEASFFRRAHTAVPQVVGVSWFRGGGPTTLVIALRKSAEGQPRRAAFAALSASNTLKQVILVDDDIDIDDPHSVLWAVSTRMRADEDLNVITGLQGSLLDPSVAGYSQTSGLIIDATKPIGRAFPPRASVPDWAVEKYPLADYEA